MLRVVCCPNVASSCTVTFVPSSLPLWLPLIREHNTLHMVTRAQLVITIRCRAKLIVHLRGCLWMKRVRKEKRGGGGVLASVSKVQENEGGGGGNILN